MADRTPYTDEFRELVEQARNALDRLFDASTHNSWLLLRTGYGNLNTALDRDDDARRDADTRPVAPEPVAPEPTQDRWRKLPRERRECLLLDVLADDALTLRQVVERINGRLGPKAVYESDVRYIVRRMFAGGELERVAETFQNKTRYRYSRRRRLEGPIADLERAFQQSEAA